MAAATATGQAAGGGMGTTIGAGRAGAARHRRERAEELFHFMAAAMLAGRFLTGARQGLEALAAFLAGVFVQWHRETPMCF